MVIVIGDPSIRNQVDRKVIAKDDPLFFMRIRHEIPLWMGY